MRNFARRRTTVLIFCISCQLFAARQSSEVEIVANFDTVIATIRLRLNPGRLRRFSAESCETICHCRPCWLCFMERKEIGFLADAKCFWRQTVDVWRHGFFVLWTWVRPREFARHWKNCCFFFFCRIRLEISQFLFALSVIYIFFCFLVILLSIFEWRTFGLY